MWSEMHSDSSPARRLGRRKREGFHQAGCVQWTEHFQETAEEARGTEYRILFFFNLVEVEK